MLLALQCVYLSGQLHSVSAEVVHGDGVVPVAKVVLLTRRLLLPLHAAHGQQHGARGHRHADGQHDPHYVHAAQADHHSGRGRLHSGTRDVPGHPGVLRGGRDLPVEKVPTGCGRDLRTVPLDIAGAHIGHLQSPQSSHIPLVPNADLHGDALTGGRTKV